jgi:hypothetical protein
MGFVAADVKSSRTRFLSALPLASPTLALEDGGSALPRAESAATSPVPRARSSSTVGGSSEPADVPQQRTVAHAEAVDAGEVDTHPERLEQVWIDVGLRRLDLGDPWGGRARGPPPGLRSGFRGFVGPRVKHDRAEGT